MLEIALGQCLFSGKIATLRDVFDGALNSAAGHAPFHSR